MIFSLNLINSCWRLLNHETSVYLEIRGIGGKYLRETMPGLWRRLLNDWLEEFF